MKKFIACCICSFVCLKGVVNAQDYKVKYTPSAGFVGAANYSRFHIGDYNRPSESDWKWGWGAGIFLNFPVGNVFSIEPQVLYNRIGSEVKLMDLSPDIHLDQQLDYISVPLLFKFNAGRYVALMIGPQFDFLVKAKDKIRDVDNKDSFRNTDIAATAGFEIFPREKITIYGRYSHGFQNIDHATQPEYFNQNFQAGLKFRLFGKRVKVAPPPPPPVVDTDNDGVPDSTDKCPTEAGVVKYNGCPVPDTDKDGINDDDDKCPTEAGTAKYNGCPVPDTDKDGINDEEDKCPDVAGISEFQGCPVPDQDKDGVPDKDDKCPTIAGVAENAGCPAIPAFDAATVEFVTGSTKLTSKGLKELDDMIEYLKKYPELYLEVIGHTDNVGNAAFNQSLSEKRASAVVNAVVKKGISRDRLGSKGFGMDQPVADNSTKEGRAKNRRVEFKFSQVKPL
jgi:outer membrane protein OmpA-like peptidoglycan-associated protein